jgi:type IV pilus assembly protein PilF
MQYRLLLCFVLLYSIIACSEISNTNSLSIKNNIDPERAAKFNLQLGLGYLEQGDVERAKGKLLRAYEQAPKSPEVHYNIAHFYYLIDENATADYHFKQAIYYSHHNNNSVLGTAYNNYGVFLCQTKRYKEADQNFQLAIADLQYADTSSAYENAGLCALKTGDKQQAQAYFEKALKTNPLSTKALIEVSDLYTNNEDYDKAKIYLDRYTRIASENKRSLLLALKLAKLQNDQSNYDDLTSRLLTKYPDPDTKQYIEYMQSYSSIDKSLHSSKLVKYTDIGKLKNIG